MSQITLYLDDDTQALVDEASKANGVSKSRWVADIIRKYAAQDWPQDCLALAGRFADFPIRETGSQAVSVADTPRIGF
ncbi:MAG: CopG family transcriptional regulator [Brachymonas sp.]|nr:CopG family transcriptional regulator [Brachymonas sp.]